MGNVDFLGGWNNLWGSIRSGPAGNFLTVMSVVGVILVIAAVVGYLWKRRKGGGSGGLGSLVIPLVIGAIFAAPNVLIPVLLKVAELVVNLAGAIVNYIF